MIKYQTEQRKVLLSLFEQDSHRTYSAHDLLEAIPDAGISLSAIYRNLKALELQGVICKTNDPKQSEAQYHYINPQDCVGIIHLKCEICDQIYHLNQHISRMIFNFTEDDLGFKLNQAGAFLYGKCSNCSQIEESKHE